MAKYRQVLIEAVILKSIFKDLSRLTMQLQILNKLKNDRANFTLNGKLNAMEYKLNL